MSYILALFSPFFEQEITIAKNRKYANERNVIKYATICVRIVNTVLIVTNIIQCRAQFDYTFHKIVSSFIIEVIQRDSGILGDFPNQTLIYHEIT